MTWDNPFTRARREKTSEEKRQALAKFSDKQLSASAYNRGWKKSASSSSGVGMGLAGVAAGAAIGKGLKERKERKAEKMAAIGREGANRRGSSNAARDDIYTGGYK